LSSISFWPLNFLKAVHKPSSVAPPHAKCVLDFISEHPDASASGAELAAISGASPRPLQAGSSRFAVGRKGARR